MSCLEEQFCVSMSSFEAVMTGLELQSGFWSFLPRVEVPSSVMSVLYVAVPVAAWQML